MERVVGFTEVDAVETGVGLAAQVDGVEKVVGLTAEVDGVETIVAAEVDSVEIGSECTLSVVDGDGSRRSVTYYGRKSRSSKMSGLRGTIPVALNPLTIFLGVNASS